MVFAVAELRTLLFILGNKLVLRRIQIPALPTVSWCSSTSQHNQTESSNPGITQCSSSDSSSNLF